jgi:lipoyl(octanoyl) transferase
MHTLLRVIYDPALAGDVNMATDQAIMEAVGDRRQTPTLRLYRWYPACLSLGYTQSVRDVDFERLDQRSWSIVRRPTGGRAILHTDELTYSISLPQDHFLAQGDILTSYRRLSEALQGMLKRLGLSSESAPHGKRGSNGPVCFEIPSAYEITIGGRKLIGSAQVRRAKAVLQHGSLPLEGDISRICEVLQYKDENLREEAKTQVRSRATTLKESLGTPISWETAAAALAEAFGELFEAEVAEGSLSPEESLRLEQLRNEVYHQESWTNKR